MKDHVPDVRRDTGANAGYGLVLATEERRVALTERLARLVGGELTVASSQGKGSTFTLRVPCPTPADPTGEADEKPIPLADVE